MRRSQKLRSAGKLSGESIIRMENYERSRTLSMAIDAQAGWASGAPWFIERQGMIYIRRTHNNEPVLVSVAEVRGCLTTPCRTCRALEALGDHRNLDRHRQPSRKETPAC